LENVSLWFIQYIPLRASGIVVGGLDLQSRLQFHIVQAKANVCTRSSTPEATIQ